MHKTETLRLADDGSGEEVGLDELQQRGVQNLRPVSAFVLQHVQQKALVENRSDDWSQRKPTHTRMAQEEGVVGNRNGDEATRYSAACKLQF